MIAAIDDGKVLHIVRWTGRVRLHAAATTYCSNEMDAGAGVIQVPEGVLTQGHHYTWQGQKRPPCGACRMAALASAG